MASEDSAHFSRLNSLDCLLIFITWYNPQNSSQQSAIAEGFAEVNSVFIVITLAKNIFPRWLFLANIYLVYNFEYYFSTKLSFTNKRYHLHVLEKRLCVLQEVWSINNLQQFIHHFSSFTPQWSKLCFHILYPCICKIL